MKQRTKGDWRDLENYVRTLASMKWGRPAVSRAINGVQCDAVLELEPDHWIAIEISRQQTLDKLRNELGKFSSIRPHLQSKSIYTKCFFVTPQQPTDQFKQTAHGNKVTALSVEDFLRTMVDFRTYAGARTQKQFGSAVDPFSGQKDDSEYVAVDYPSDSAQEPLLLPDIVKYLQAGKRVVLVGQYGTGKSRCHQQIFHRLSESAYDGLLFPISIDLRDMWGCRRASEIIRRHFDDLGLSDSADMVLKIFNVGGLCFLLDGFDEISSQAWSDDPNRLKHIRRDALAGVSDLISSYNGPVIVSGREHYFNDDEEMLASLGLDARTTLVVRCKENFSESETSAFLRRIGTEMAALPTWLPRRPLILQTLMHLDQSERNRILSADGGEAELCRALIDVICEREAKIRSILDPVTIRRILQQIARGTRQKGSYSAPITVGEINKGFERVVGTTPVDESVVMLQRLPALGRISAETNDRRFVDLFLLDGLLGIDVTELVRHPEEGAYREKWIDPVREVGQAIIAQDAVGNEDLHLEVGMKCLREGNSVLGIDIISALLLVRKEPVDLGGMRVEGAEIFSLDMSECAIANGSIVNSHIEQLVLPAVPGERFLIEKSMILNLYGVASEQGLPGWISNTKVDSYESVSTLSKIKQARLSDAQIMFLSIVKKTFFQPGSGRKEVALLRGIGNPGVSRHAEAILRLLRKEGIVNRIKGQEGWVYVPERKYMRRMGISWRSSGSHKMISGNA